MRNCLGYYILLLFSVLFTDVVNAQMDEVIIPDPIPKELDGYFIPTYKEPDSLKNLNYDALGAKYNTWHDNYWGGSRDSIAEKSYVIILKTILNRLKVDLIKKGFTKKEKDTMAYKYINIHYKLSSVFNTPKYADSMFKVGKYIDFGKWKTTYYLYNAYVNNRFSNNTKEDYLKEMNFYQKSYEVAKRNNLVYYEESALDELADVRYKLGEYEKALRIHKKYIIRPNQLSWSIRRIIQCHLQLQQLDSAKKYIDNIPKHEIDRTEDNYNYYHYYKGWYHIKNKQYRMGRENLSKVGKSVALKDTGAGGQWHLAQLMGDSFLEEKNQDSALYYYEKAFQKNTLDFVYLTVNAKVLNRLIEILAQRNDSKKLLEYIDLKIALNEKLKQDKYAIKSVYNNEIDPKQLQVLKKETIEELDKQKNRSFLLLFGVSSLTMLGLFGLVKYRKKATLRKSELQGLLSEKESKLDSAYIHSILKSLAAEEEKLFYLKPTVNIDDLAKKLETNRNYLSKIINQEKKKSFSLYINDLRIDYCLEKLEKDSSYRKYSMDALSKELGYSNTSSFNRAFKRKTKFTPYEYITKKYN